MGDRIYNVLFLCTGNSARSILAESVMTKEGAGRFRAFSAGSNPKGDVHPVTLDVLKAFDFPHEGLRSKSWSEFDQPEAPQLDFIFTLCDDAAGETCPTWPGKPITAHWGIENPVVIEGDGKREAFLDALRYLRRRIELFVMLPHGALDQLTIDAKLRQIGREEGASKKALS